MKLLSSLIIGILMGGLVALALFHQPLVNTVFATPPTVSICHWDEGQNAYKPPQSVSYDSIYKWNNGQAACKTDGHGNDPQDIIPSFINGECAFSGLNLDKESWIANDCKDPTLPSPVDGACGETLNSCTAGTLNNITDSLTQYLWECVGTNGGTKAQCSLAIVTPSCGNGNIEAGETCDDGNLIDGDGCSATCQTETLTPSPTPGLIITTTTTGGPGDGLSDGRSDGGSSCPTCTTAAPSGNVLGVSTEEGQVLGASTDILAATGSNYQLSRLWIAATSALVIFLLGHTLVRGNETS